MKVLVIEPSYPVIACGDISDVIVIGCGGTGSYVIRDLARAISTLAKKPNLLLIDGDVVEEKNLKRQNFIASDITKNKAETLARRYAALGIVVAHKAQFLEKGEDLRAILKNMKGNVLIISCVDNAKSRAMIRAEYLSPRGTYTNYWIDCGNEEFHGQVALGVSPPSSSWNLDTLKVGYYPVPDVFDVRPALVELAKLDKMPSELSCAEMAVSSPQYGFVNATAAMLAVNWAQDLLSKRPIKTHFVDFSIDNRFVHKSLSQSDILSWLGTFAPIQGHKVESLLPKQPPGKIMV